MDYFLRIMLEVLFGIFSIVLLHGHAEAAKKSYIVYMGGHSHGVDPTKLDFQRTTHNHHSFLASYLGSKEAAKDAIFYSYNKHINGFSTVLEEEHAAAIARHPDVISVFPDRGLKLHTTQSWDFMLVEKSGAIRPSSIWSRASFGEDTIIANLDTGAWPESESFTDYDYGPVPSKWKGGCKGGPNFKCNKKLIGSRFYYKGYLTSGAKINSTERSSRDNEGHGTHTLSTLGGNFATGAARIQNGTIIGTPKGGSPRARVVPYRVCWKPYDGNECFDSDILAGFDDAIEDGVDVFSVSLGGDAVNYFENGIAIGAFHATRSGAVVVCSAGNEGPQRGTLGNVAPWLITVAASTTDRKFVSYAKLNNGLTLEGVGFSPSMSKEAMYPLITGAEAKSVNASAEDAMLCVPDSLDSNKVKGKIVVCLRGRTDRVDKSYQVLKAGGVGMILCNDESSGNSTYSDAHFLPTVHLNYTQGLKVLSYMTSTKNPMAYITPVEVVVDNKPSPQMADFSSVGPNTITPQLLKPDITAPGVDIIAAVSNDLSLTSEAYDHRSWPYFTMSGTSMSTPHVAGVAGLLRTIHPDWSPAAIQSAIMTTARTRDNTGEPIKDYKNTEATPFNYGSGHIRPNRVADPGLVYDTSADDYLAFLCAQGYNETTLRPFIVDRSYKCSETANVYDLNYPSISVPNMRVGQTVVVRRKVKNVGTPGTYEVTVRRPRGVSVKVEPSFLVFEHKGEEKTYDVILTAKVKGLDYQFGGLMWSDGRHYVRSPIAISTN